MNKFYFLPFTLFLIGHFNLSAQIGPIPGPGFINIVIQKRVELSSGDIRTLKNVKHVNIRFDYEYMAVCKSKTEADYLDSIRKKYRKRRADQEIAYWNSLPKKVLEPRFKTFFNKFGEDIGLRILKDSTLKQPTLIVKVIYEDPHYHRSGSGLPRLSTDCTFLDEEGNFMIRFLITAIGSRESNIADRLGECYAITGKMLAREITKLLKKSEVRKK